MTSAGSEALANLARIGKLKEEAPDARERRLAEPIHIVRYEGGCSIICANNLRGWNHTARTLKNL